MNLSERLENDLKEAMKAGDTTRRDTIRLLRNAIRNAEINSRGALSEDDAANVVAKEVKQRRESISEYKKAERQDLVDKEQAELDVLQAYQPEQLSPEELDAIVREEIARSGAGPGEMGKVMKPVMARVRGKADGSEVQAAVKRALTSS